MECTEKDFIAPYRAIPVYPLGDLCGEHLPAMLRAQKNPYPVDAPPTDYVGEPQLFYLHSPPRVARLDGAAFRIGLGMDSIERLPRSLPPAARTVFFTSPAYRFKPPGGGNCTFLAPPY